jgi:hypothetical protein
MAEEDGMAVRVGEGGESFVEDRLQAFPDGVRMVCGVHGGKMLSEFVAFAVLAFGELDEIAGLHGSGDVKPAGERVAAGEGAGLAGEGDEGKLGGLGGESGIATDPKRGVVDQPGISADEGSEGLFGALFLPSD